MTEASRISKPTNGVIEFVTRAIILDGNKMLACKPVGKDFFYLPGGHVEFGEQALETVKREIIEETGVEARTVEAIGFVDHIYNDADAGFTRHEVNLLYKAELISTKLNVTEDHFTFEWLDVNDLKNKKVLPENLKNFIVEYLKK